MQFTIVGREVDRDVAWSVLSDTDAMNRVAGNSAVVSTLEHGPDGPVVVGEMIGPMGMRMPFRETGGWIDQRWFRQERVFSGGPVSSSRFVLELEPSGQGVRPKLTLELEGPLAFRPLLAALVRRIRLAWQRVLEGLPAPGEVAVSKEMELPAELRQALSKWSSLVEPAIVEAFRGWFAEGSALELQSMRAFQLADRWGLDRESVLVAMLRGVRSGVFELYWSVQCPACRSEVSASTTLSDLSDHADCASCDLTFDNDLSINIEVLFAPHPGVLPRVEQSFCSFFPAGAPEIKGALVVPAGQTLEESIVVGAGGFTLGVGEDVVSVVVGASGDEEISWRPGQVGERKVRAGRVSLRLSNPEGRALRVMLVAKDLGLDRVPASLLTSLAEFRREMSDQVLGTDVRLSTRSVTLLFTDLSGSTAMFEALGDARAYGVVNEHFRILGRIIEAHQGAVVKTIGDAVMASFHRVPDAFAAALRMRAEFDAWVETLELDPPPRLNIGIHEGPALVVHSDAHGLDYFGRTVNLAARCQSAATEGEIALTETVCTHPIIAEQSASLPLKETVHQLKGIGAVRLWKLPR